MPTIAPIHSARASVGGATRWKLGDLPERRRDLEVSKLAAHITAVVEAAPPPTPEQVLELARLLTPPMQATAVKAVQSA